MTRIYLTRHPDRAPFDRGPRTLWVHPKGSPPVASAAMECAAFLASPLRALRRADLVVVTGLGSRLVTPANRVRLGPYLTEPWDGPPRVSVDTGLFVGEPWRLWWHFGCVGAPFGPYATSYALETRWRGYLDRRVPKDPCALVDIVQWGQGVIRSDAPCAFAPPRINTISLPADVHAAYAVEKARAFEEATSLPGILARLGRFAQARCPQRAMPRGASLFTCDASPPQITRTDLPIDNYLLSVALERMALTNAIGEAFR